jgi:hypothetical protein
MQTRASETALALCIILLIASGASGVVIPTLPAGFEYLKNRNAEMSTTYVVAGLAAGDQFTYDPIALVNGVATPATGNLNGTAGVVRNVTKFQAAGAVDADGAGPGTRLEDAWGIGLMYQIDGGRLYNPGSPGSMVGYNGPLVYDNAAGTNVTWLTAMFHGGLNTQVVTRQGRGVTTDGIPIGDQRQDVSTTGLAFDLYAVDATGINATLVGAAKDPIDLADHVATSRVDLNTSTGWTGDTISGSVLLATGTSNYFQSTVVVDAAGNVVSNAQDAANAYFDVDPLGAGSWNPAWGYSDRLLTPTGDPTNLWFQWTLDSGTRGWEVHSDDIGGAYAPEPATLALLALGGLALPRQRRQRR